MGKILPLSKLVNELRSVKEEQTVGLITGCFDLLHPRHFDLFRFAKNHIDILVVGVDTGESIKASKGRDPLFSQEDRLKMLSEITVIDYVFPLTLKDGFNTAKAKHYHINICSKLSPNHLITCVDTDKYWRQKESRIQKLGGTLIKKRTRDPLHSTDLIKNLRLRNIA